jgi:hypothetical protein
MSIKMGRVASFDCCLNMWLNKRLSTDSLSASHTPVSHPDLNAKRKGTEESSLNFSKNGGH